MRAPPVPAAAAALLLFCTPPPPLLRDSVPPLCEALFGSDDGLEIRAAGDAVICLDGEKHGGSSDVLREARGRFRADFTAPLGFIAASVEADGEKGSVDFDERTYAFSRGQTMDSLPFSWGRDFTFRTFEELLLGRVPRDAGGIMRRPPDSMTPAGRKAINALWKTDSLMIGAVISRNPDRCEKITITGLKRSSPWKLTMSGFRKGRSHKIELVENEKNYFSLRYSKLTVR